MTMSQNRSDPLPEAENASPRLYLRVLGGLSLSPPGFQSAKPLALLAYLAVESQYAPTRETVAAMLWPESGAGPARSALRQALHQIRHELPSSEAGAAVLGDRGRIWLNPDYPLSSDLWDFLGAVHLGEAADKAELDRGVQAYGGPFLDGFYIGQDSSFDEWAAGRRGWLREQARLLFGRLIARQQEAGETDAALQTAARYVSLDPEDEAGRRQLNTLLAETPFRATEAPPPTRVERRRITVLYCVLPLPESGPEEAAVAHVAAARTAAREELEDRGGRVEITPSGDVVAYFGLPPTVERAVATAVAAARALLGLSELGAPQVGLHGGWSLLGHGGHPDYLGGVVREARAVAQAAPLGSLWLTAAVAERLPPGLGATPVSPSQEGHGYYALTGPVPSQHRRTTTLVGRRPELASLLRQARRLRTGQGAAVALVGEAGVGKTRLLEEARRRLGRRVRFWEAGAVEGEAGTPLAPMVRLLEDLCGAGPDLDPGQRRRRLAQCLEGYANLTGEQRRTLLHLFPDEGDDPQAPVDPLPALEALVREEARTPLVLVVEDLHWADEATSDLLRRLASAAPDIPLLLVVSSRPGAAPEWSGLQRLPLEPLDPAEAEALVAATEEGRNLSPPEREAVARSSEGVPLYAEELVRARQRGVAKDGKNPAAPGSLAELFASRLDEAGAAGRTAQIAALVGREVGAELLAELDGRDRAAVEADLQALHAVDLVQERHTSRGCHYHLKHALLQEGIYATLPDGERAILHERLARLLGERYPHDALAHPDWLARHYELAGRNLEAAQYRFRAANHSAHLGAHEQALGHLSRTRELLEAVPASSERADLARRVEHFYAAQSLFPHGFHHPRREMEGVVGADDFQGLYASLLSGVGEENWADLLLRAEELWAVAEAGGEWDEILTARHLVGFTANYAGDLPLAEQHMVEVLPDGMEAAPELLVRLYNGPPKAVELAYRAVVALRRGRSVEARWAEKQAREMARQHGSPILLAYVLTLCASTHRHARRPAPALELAREIVALSREEGLRATRIIGMGYREWARSALGRRNQGDRLLAVARGEGGNTGGFIMASHVVPIFGFQERWRDQEALIRRLLDGREECRPPPNYYDELYTALGEALVARGENEEGAYWLRQAEEAARASDSRLQHLRVVMQLARLLSRQGEVSEAERALSAAISTFPAGGDKADLDEARQLWQWCRGQAELEE